ncbi:ester cyclase [Pantoea cypripedii]|uniref:Ester cyclase n=1 Tax=Pantoea cypripedii TaxID=55209 RepID=A0A6B9GGW0_PANCY|nr:ester cyclase [Pantoea cypripedii]QGY32556.1 ester cyclase [Pantoea cypripedii]
MAVINKEAVWRFNHEVIAAGDRAAFDELVAASFINRSALPGTPDDRESLWRTFDQLLRPALSGLSVVIDELVAERDWVTTRKRISGIHSGTLLGVAPTGLAVTIDVIDMVRLENGQYVEHWGMNTLPSVVTQLKKHHVET